MPATPASAVRVFVAWAADHADREGDVLSSHDDVEGLRRMSQALDHANQTWRSWLDASGGSVISLGGSDGVGEVQADKLAELPPLREQYANAVGCPASVGIGTRLGEATQALRAARIRGGGQIAFYGEDVEEDIKADEQRRGHAMDKAEQEPLSKMAMIHNDLAHPMTVYRVQDDRGRGPHDVGASRSYGPDPVDDFYPHEWGGKPRAQREPLRFAFERPEHAQAWFGHEMPDLQKLGFQVVPVQASRVWRARSGRQVIYEPAIEPGPMSIGRLGEPGGWATDHQGKPYALPGKPLGKAGEGHPEHTVAMNDGAGAGYTGPSEGAHPAAPKPAEAEASQSHSSAEAAREVFEQSHPPAPEGTQAARTLEDHFRAAAERQRAADDDEQQQKAGSIAAAKQQVAQALQMVRGQAPIFQELQQQAPEAYAAVMGLAQAVVALAREFTPTTQAVAKSEEPLVKDERPKAAPPGFVDSFDHVRAHVLANDPHGGGMRGATKFGINQIRPDEYYWPKRPVKLDVDDPELDTHEPASEDDVARYAKALKSGSEPPAVFGIVSRDGSFISVLDGAHRIKSKQVAGQRFIGGYIGLPKHLAGTGHPVEALGAAAERRAKKATRVAAPAPARVRATAKGEAAPEGKIEREPDEPRSPAAALDKAGLPMPGAPARNKLNLPVGTQLPGVGKFKVRHVGGDTSWKQGRAGVILSQDPAIHPTSSREPNAR